MITGEIKMKNNKEKRLTAKRKTALRVGLVAAALLMIVIGLILGQEAGVWKKAAAICMECIGLG